MPHDEDEQDGRPVLVVKRVPRGLGRKKGHAGFMVVKVSGEGFADPSYPDLAQLVKDWGERQAQGFRGAKAQANIRYIHKSALASLPDRPTERAYLAWFQALHDRQGYAAGTVRRIYNTMHRLYERARTKGALWMNPCADLDLPRNLKKPRKKAVLAITDRNVKDAYDRVYRALTGPSEWEIRNRGLVAVLRYTGIRITEALGIEADQVDLERGRLYIEQERDYTAAHDKCLKPFLKDDAQRRWLPMHPELAAELRKVLRLGPAKMLTGNMYGPRKESPYVFPHLQSHLELLNDKIIAVLSGIGYGKTGYRWHSWRHAWALEALLNTEPPVSLMEISKWLGHSSIAVTEKYLRKLRGYETPASQLKSLWEAQSRRGEIQEQGTMLSEQKEEHVLSVVRPPSGERVKVGREAR